MRKIYIPTIIVIAASIVLSSQFFHRVKNGQIQYQKDILHSQVQRCGGHVENTIREYESDLNRIIFKNIQNIYKIFDDQATMFYVGRDLEAFYAKYRDLITSVSVIDDEDQFYGIYISDDDDFVVDTFARQIKNELEPRETIKTNNATYTSYFPFFLDGNLKGNIIVGIDLNKYLQKVFELYNITGLIYQWVINSEGEIILSNFDREFQVFDINRLSDSLKNEAEGSIEHHMKLGNQRFRIISAYYPLNVAQNDLGMIFSMNTGYLLDIFMKKYTILTSVLLFLLIGLISFLLYQIYIHKKSQVDLKSRFEQFQMILEHFPVGIMVLDKSGIIKMINQTGQRMLFLNENENLTGKNFNDQFLVTNRYLLDENNNNGFERDHFIHYVREGNEIVIYRKDETIEFQGEELSIAALMDVSMIEKSRKKEAAANQAKSDFLARMSHEIRIPMNGIMGMSDELISDSLGKQSKEKVKIIRKSADLLMNLINDILDISKIEAGKMMLEEIPFNLREELNITASLFKPLAKEKELEFNISIDPSVPERLIGDPFRLRQVVSNLLSNSIKFTSDGYVSLSVEVMERYKNRLSLLFRVKDTGIGIPREKLNTIFEDYEQSEYSTARNYGGTGLGMAISKQLVELMNGEIWIEGSTPGSMNRNFPGTSIAFNIEAYTDESLNKNYDYSSINRYNQITALILSRKKDSTDNIHRVLDGFGINYNYKVYEDNEMDDVISHIHEKATLYQLIIIKDKPGNEGFGMALRLKESGISTQYPVILISSNDKKGNYLKSKSLDIDYYLIQPYDTHEVFHILEKSFPNIQDVNGILDQVNKIKNNLKILIAEDNPINQRVAQSLFKQLGQEVELANNGQEVLEMLLEKSYDVIFMDVLMPVMDGLTATKEIRKSGNNVRIIGLTGAEDNEKQREAQVAGMDDYLVKPVRLEDIKSLLIRWFSEVMET